MPNITYEDIIHEHVSDLSREQLDEWIDKINAASHKELCLLERFAPGGHPVFYWKFEIFKLFDQRFFKLGGMTPPMSKLIGFDLKENFKK